MSAEFDGEPVTKIETANDEGMFEDGVELSDLTQHKREMITAMKDYKEEKMKLKSLYVEKETE